MTATQLWETTMDPERRTLLSVKLEDIAETEAIFTTLMGEDVEARRKFIEDNALDVKNLDVSTPVPEVRAITVAVPVRACGKAFQVCANSRSALLSLRLGSPVK